jgi:hypothetical protein
MIQTGSCSSPSTSKADFPKPKLWENLTHKMYYPTPRTGKTQYKTCGGFMTYNSLDNMKPCRCPRRARPHGPLPAGILSPPWSRTPPCGIEASRRPAAPARRARGTFTGSTALTGLLLFRPPCAPVGAAVMAWIRLPPFSHVCGNRLCPIPAPRRPLPEHRRKHGGNTGLSKYGKFLEKPQAPARSPGGEKLAPQCRNMKHYYEYEKTG